MGSLKFTGPITSLKLKVNCWESSIAMFYCKFLIFFFKICGNMLKVDCFSSCLVIPDLFSADQLNLTTHNMTLVIVMVINWYIEQGSQVLVQVATLPVTGFHLVESWSKNYLPSWPLGVYWRGQSKDVLSPWNSGGAFVYSGFVSCYRMAYWDKIC